MDEPSLSFEDYRLTKAEIFYHESDGTQVLETYVWQSLDRLPDFPRLNEFLHDWEQRLDGRLHSVKIAFVGAIEPPEWQYANAFFTLH